MFYICWVFNRGQIIKNLSQTAFHKVYKVSPDLANHKTQGLLRESGTFSPGCIEVTV